MPKHNRDIGIDVLKCLCAFFVVMIHAPFHVHLAPYTVAIARVGVPVFFMITGFYFPAMQEKGRTTGHLRKLSLLTLASCLFYFLWHVCYLNAHPQRYLRNFTNPDTLFDFLIYNVCPFEGHLWYFFALLYALPLLMLADRLRITKYLVYAVPLLLTANYLLTYTGHYAYYRNWLLTALPYLSLGIALRTYRERIASRLPAPWVMCTVFLILCLLLYFEWSWYYRHHAAAYRDDYLCTPWMALSLFCIALTGTEKSRKSSDQTSGKLLKKTNVFFEALAYVGRKYSPYIYIFHIAVKSSFHFWRHWRWVYLLYPLWLFAFTLLLCAIAWGVYILFRRGAGKLRQDKRLIP